MNRKENQWVINYINIHHGISTQCHIMQLKKKKRKKEKMKNVSECFHGRISGDIFLKQS